MADNEEEDLLFPPLKKIDSGYEGAVIDEEDPDDDLIFPEIHEKAKSLPDQDKGRIRETLQKAAQIATAPGRTGRGVGVLLQKLASGDDVDESITRSALAMELGYEPEEGEVAGAILGDLAGNLPLFVAAASAATPVAAGAGIARGGMAMEAVVTGFGTGTLEALDEMAEKGEVDPKDVAIATGTGVGAGAAAHKIAGAIRRIWPSLVKRISSELRMAKAKVKEKFGHKLTTKELREAVQKGDMTLGEAARKSREFFDEALAARVHKSAPKATEAPVKPPGSPDYPVQPPATEAAKKNVESIKAAIVDPKPHKGVNKKLAKEIDQHTGDVKALDDIKSGAEAIARNPESPPAQVEEAKAVVKMASDRIDGAVYSEKEVGEALKPEGQKEAIPEASQPKTKKEVESELAEMEKTVKSIRKKQAEYGIADYQSERMADAELKIQELRSQLDFVKSTKEVRESLKNPKKKVEMAESDLLKMRLKAEARGARWGDIEGSKRIRRKIHDELRVQQESVKNVKSSIIGYINDLLPPSSRGKFLSLVSRAKTQRDVGVAFARVNRELSVVYRKKAISDIRKITSRALDANNVAVEYKRKIGELLEAIELKGHSKKTIEKLEKTKEYVERQEAMGAEVYIPPGLTKRITNLAKTPIKRLKDEELRGLLEDVKRLEKLGKTMTRVRHNLYKIEQDRIREEVLSGVKPLEKWKPRKIRLPGETPSWIDGLREKIEDIQNGFQHTDMALLPMDAFFDMMDGGQMYMGPMHRNFKASLDADFGRYLDYRDDLWSPVEALIVKYKMGQKEAERIGVYLIREQSGGTEHLMSRGMTKEQIQSYKLTDREMEVAKLMRSLIEKTFPRVKKAIAELYNRDIGKEEKYFPFHTEYELLADVLIGNRFGDKHIEGRLTKTEEQGFTKARSEAAKQAVQVDAFAIFRKHIDDVAYLVETQRRVKMLFEIANTPEFRQAAGEIGSRVTLEWLDLMARKGGMDGVKRIEWLRTLRRNFGVAALGFKLSSVMIQPTALADGAAQIGGRYVILGMRDVLSREWREFLLKNFPELRRRIGDDKAFQDLSSRHWLAKAQNKSFAGLMWMDSKTAAAVTAGAYRKAPDQMGKPLDLTVPDEEAVKKATFWMRNSQASALFKDVGLALSRGGLTGNKEIDDALLQFHTFILKRWSLLRYDVPEQLRHGNRADAAATVMWITMATMAETLIRRGVKYFLGAVLVGAGLSKAVPKEEDPIIEDFLQEAFRTIPFMSHLTSIVVYDSGVAPAIAPLTDLPKSVAYAANARTARTRISHTTRALEALASLTGTPGVSQVGQLVRMMIKEKRLHFPYSLEFRDLESDYKQNRLTNAERVRYFQLKMAKRVFDKQNQNYKNAISRGDTKGMRDAAQNASDAMKAFRK